MPSIYRSQAKEGSAELSCLTSVSGWSQYRQDASKDRQNWHELALI